MKKRIIFFVSLLFLIGYCACNDNKSYQSMNVSDFQKAISDDAVQIVDVRTPEEYRQGHIEKAVNMDIQNLNFDQQVKALDMGYPVAVYCSTGGRSKKAAKKMADMGFNVYELEDGIEALQMNEYPLVKESQQK